MRSIFLLALLSFTTAWTQDDSKLPPDAQKIVAAFDAAAAKLRADVEKQIDKKALDAISDLRKAQENATKKNDLDGAVAIKAKIAALVPKDAVKDDRPADPMQELIGTWDIIGTSYSIQTLPNKTAIWKGAAQGFKGSWTWDAKHSAMRIAWNNGSYESLHYIDHNSVESREESADGVELKKKSGTRSTMVSDK